MTRRLRLIESQDPVGVEDPRREHGERGGRASPRSPDLRYVRAHGD